MKVDETRCGLILVHTDFVRVVGHIVDLVQGDISDAGQLVFLPLGIGHE